MAEPADSQTDIASARTALTSLFTRQAALRTSQSHNATRLSQPKTQIVYGSHSDGYGDWLRELDRVLSQIEEMAARWA